MVIFPDNVNKPERSPTGPIQSGNLIPVLHEVRHGLERLAATAEATVIDLHGLPFGPGDERRLLDVLGEGEVSAELDALGKTRIWETSFPGVWLIDHRNADGQRIAFQLEVTRIPDILCSQDEDIIESAARLNSFLTEELAAPAASLVAKTEEE